MYYWKPGSRCEVGLWRGCLPNLNMFQDEYECVATCIFTARARAQDYHSVNEIGESGYDETTDTTASSDDNCTVTSAGDTVTFAGGTVTSGNVNIGGENARATSSGNDQSTNSDQAGATNGHSEGITTTE
ncbi:unnamed protein product [Parnassius apollo]|uniref:(apollo) hypothetical protein n=1 Tax=Parnassius apollo TaxID=110799 RepID=A0A8S3WQL6_PARAO|nr:unnamed protein product [Parnassius apollo]